MSDPLQPPPDEIFRLGQSVLERIAAYYDTLRDRPIIQPTTAAALRSELDEPLPRTGHSLDTLLDRLDNTLLRYSRHNGHPRFFGYIASPGTPVAAFSHALAATYNI